MTRPSFRSLPLGAALGALALSLAVTATPALAADTAAGNAADAPAAAPALEPQSYGTFGIDLAAMDTSVKPGDDFDAYVNGTWTKAAVVPADRSAVGGFYDLDELSENRLHAMLQQIVASSPAPGSAEARIADAYNAFMDTDAINAAGLAPAQPYLERIYAAKNGHDLGTLFGSPGFASPVGFGVGADPKQSDVYAVQTAVSGLGLPDRDYYLDDSARSQEIRAKYSDYLAFLLGKLGYADAKGAAASVLALETQIARADWDRTIERNRDLTYHKLSVADFEALGSQGTMSAFLDVLGAQNAPYVLVREMPVTAEQLAAAKIDPAKAPSLMGGGLPAVAGLVDSVPLATWQAWLAENFLRSHASVLPSDIDDATFAFYGTVLNGQPEQRPRWKRAISSIEGMSGELLGKLYYDRYYPPEQKAKMAELVGNLRAAMAVNLQDAAWMSPATRKEAEAKLAAFTPKIGGPDKFKTYDGLAFSPTDPLGNTQAAAVWETGFEVNRIGKPVDKAEWAMLPETVNAYYNATKNEVVFPAAILQPPFFSLTADPAVNYGAIGAVIGHEMGHGFDDQGAKSDGAGNLRDWWTPQDKANFVKLQDKLAAQYDQFCPYDDGKTCVNGHLTMGENLGDLGGIAMAYRAYHLSLGGKPAPVIDGFTGDQRFFMAYAQVWRQKRREADARKRLVTDPHSPPHYRINGIVRNFDAWYKAFDVKPGDALYLPPAERVHIW